MQNLYAYNFIYVFWGKFWNFIAKIKNIKFRKLWIYWKLTNTKQQSDTYFPSIIISICFKQMDREFTSFLWIIEFSTKHSASHLSPSGHHYRTRYRAHTTLFLTPNIGPHEGQHCSPQCRPNESLHSPLGRLLYCSQNIAAKTYWENILKSDLTYWFILWNFLDFIHHVHCLVSSVFYLFP